MPIRDVATDAGTFTHVCLICGHQRAGLTVADVTRGEGCLAIRPCPTCGSVECCNSALDASHLLEREEIAVPGLWARVYAHRHHGAHRDQARAIQHLDALHRAASGAS